MPLDAPVTIATLLDSLLMFTIAFDPTPRPPNVRHCELRVARMRISIHGPYAEESFETARQHPILHPERIVRQSGRVGIHDHEISTGKSASVRQFSLDDGQPEASACFLDYFRIADEPVPIRMFLLFEAGSNRVSGVARDRFLELISPNVEPNITLS
jgi:hypothetical protein